MSWFHFICNSGFPLETSTRGAAAPRNLACTHAICRGWFAKDYRSTRPGSRENRKILAPMRKKVEFLKQPLQTNFERNRIGSLMQPPHFDPQRPSCNMPKNYAQWQQKLRLQDRISAPKRTKSTILKTCLQESPSLLYCTLLWFRTLLCSAVFYLYCTLLSSTLLSTLAYAILPNSPILSTLGIGLLSHFSTSGPASWAHDFLATANVDGP
jgi:hypothetical protein